MTATFAPDLAAIRAMANVLPGPRPVAVNGIRVAASIRPRKFAIQGGDESAVTMPRTAFQLVYPDCTVMIDSGLDNFVKAEIARWSPILRLRTRKGIDSLGIRADAPVHLCVRRCAAALLSPYRR